MLLAIHRHDVVRILAELLPGTNVGVVQQSVEVASDRSGNDADLGGWAGRAEGPR
ncbi:hypothetical protein SAMN05216215_108618 [Saccharopolyspora shandongensis]|uniref:Uncharacterized protein n=1 Tax=Saccharopolyspora shandongensis TaxID=418495 RepID=A0A1H3TKH4_9PSEU|nr:hypothetical protein [Saccharopolyspora shandongensis]SDZ50792.1 hypothetical protein SAMN05216215_108618 [Saccharopolyspora shandongensis]